MTESQISYNPDPDDDAYGLDEPQVKTILAAVEAGDAALLDKSLDNLHAADIADLLEQISSEDRRALLQLWSVKLDGDVLSELEDGVREDVIAALPHNVLTEAVRDLESDDVVDLVEDLDDQQQGRVLGALDKSDRAVVEHSLSYPEDSAGRMMQREMVMVPQHWSVGQAIDYLRAAKELPEQFYHVVLVDAKLRPVAQVSLGKIMAAGRDVRLSEIADEDFRTIPASQNEADVAYAFNQYHMVSAPVVGKNGRLVGVITIDDAMGVLDEEAEEDMLLIAGAGGEESLSDTVSETIGRRFVWLLANLFTAILASLVISQFSGSIQRVVALAVLMPIVASMGGNAGTQTMAVAVRGLATRDLTHSNALRIFRRELLVGLLNGLGFAAIMALVVIFWFGQPMLAVVIALAMVLNMIAAAVAGVLIPIALERVHVDPALASGTFVTTVTDVVGFLAFLGLGSWLLL